MKNCLIFLEKASKALEILINYRIGKEISKEEKENFYVQNNY
jgi:hypothetical protein